MDTGSVGCDYEAIMRVFTIQLHSTEPMPAYCLCYDPLLSIQRQPPFRSGNRLRLRPGVSNLPSGLPLAFG